MDLHGITDAETFSQKTRWSLVSPSVAGSGILEQLVQSRELVVVISRNPQNTSTLVNINKKKISVSKSSHVKLICNDEIDFIEGWSYIM